MAAADPFAGVEKLDDAMSPGSASALPSSRARTADSWKRPVSADAPRC